MKILGGGQHEIIAQQGVKQIQSYLDKVPLNKAIESQYTAVVEQLLILHDT